jgi:hypothetical protein
MGPLHFALYLRLLLGFDDHSLIAIHTGDSSLFYGHLLLEEIGQ